MTTLPAPYMNEQQVMTFLKSPQANEQNKGLEIIAREKGSLLKKHRFPAHFNQDDKDDVFYKALFVFFDKTQQGIFIHDSDTSIEKYLYRIMSNLILGKKRQRKETPVEDIVAVSTATQQSDTTIFKTEALEKISELLHQKVGELCRKILIGKYYWGKQYKEIAEEIGFQINSTKNRGSSCLKALKKAMQDDPQLEKYIRQLLH